MPSRTKIPRNKTNDPKRYFLFISLITFNINLWCNCFNNFRNRYFLPAVKASIGEPFRFHDLRHTAVALAIKENKHPFEISKMLGHTSIKTTFDVYGHLL